MSQTVMTIPAWYEWGGWNTQIFLWVNHFSDNSLYQGLMQFVSDAFRSPLFLVYTLLILFYILFFCTKDLVLRGRWIRAFMILNISALVGYEIIGRLKVFFSHPRPSSWLPEGSVRLLEVMAQPDTHKSFPSGHTFWVTLLVCSLWPVLSRQMRWFGVGLIFLVGWSRLAVGKHFPADVLGAILVTVTVVLFIKASVDYSLPVFSRFFETVKPRRRA